MSLKPNPPSYFEVHISIFFWPHYKLAMMLLILEHRDEGKQKHDITYTGVAKEIALINTSLPPLDNNFSFHPEHLLSILSQNMSKICILDH